MGCGFFFGHHHDTNKNYLLCAGCVKGAFWSCCHVSLPTTCDVSIIIHIMLRKLRLWEVKSLNTQWTVGHQQMLSESVNEWVNDNSKLLEGEGSRREPGQYERKELVPKVKRLCTSQLFFCFFFFFFLSIFKLQMWIAMGRGRDFHVGKYHKTWMREQICDQQRDQPD